MQQFIVNAILVTMSVKNLGHNGARGEVIRAGLLKKLKTTRKKYFVLRAETPESSARLEYYDSEKKFKNGVPPKRSISLKTCFNINKRTDTKYKHVIALYTKDDCFCIILDSEEEQEAWLKDILSLLHGEETPVGEQPRRWFEHVWQVAILNRGLGTGITGNYRLCLTDKTLSLIKKDESSTIDLKLSNIRTCGKCQNFFCLEIGRSSQLGAGELWMLSEDANIAQNMLSTIYAAMKGSKKDLPEDLTPKSRTRSSSATEASKPNTFQRKQVLSGLPKAHVFAQEPHVTPISSTNTVAATSTVTVLHPTASGGLGTIISHQRTQSLPLTDHHTIFAPPITSVIDTTPPNPNFQSTLSRVGSVASSNFAGPPASSKRTNQSTTKCGNLSGRERCDSMPSRPRTTSENTHPLSMWKHLTPQRSHGRDISHSPPSGSPVSPPSVGCSTDSTGSSYSLADEPDMCMECSDAGLRYSSAALTPDEAIAEEDCPEGSCLYTNDYVPMDRQSSDDGCYMDMSVSPRCRYHHHSTHSPTASMSSVTSGTPSTDMKFSDYPLDKVSSFFTVEEDDTRPARAYSVGSRPDSCRNKRHVELPGTPEDSRVRAFSVGSKTKKVPCRVLPPHHHGIKSSSAPILSNSRSHSSHSSLGPMDDLMEMDFSTSNTGSSTHSEYAHDMQANNNKTTTSGYVEMKPGVEIKRKISSTPSEVSPYVDMSGGYMEMSGSSPSRQGLLSPQQEEYPSFVDINRQYRLMPNDQPLNNNYLDMEHRTRTVSNSSSHTYGDDYLDMSGSQSRLQQTSSSMSVSPNRTDYMPLNFFQQNSSKVNGNVSKTPDGYVEMTLGNKKNQRQPSIDAGTHNDDTVAGGAKKKSGANAMKTVSQPITISQTTSSSQIVKNSSPLSISSLLGRKSTSSTPSKMHLPLSSWSTSPYSSLPRQRNRKDSQNSKDNSSSSSVTTPSSSSTIFPLSLNSPSSPLRPQNKTETPSSLKLPSAIFNAIYKNSNRASASSKSNTNTNDDYTMMDFEKTNPKPKDTSEYVNYAPAVTNPITTAVTPVAIVTPAAVVTQAPIVTPEADDYALMEPDFCEAARVTTCPIKSVTSDGLTSPLITNLSSIRIQENQLFRPIRDDAKTMGSSPTSDMVSRKSECLRQCSSSSSSTESPYETLRAGECVSPAAKISRPNSVSSEFVKTSSPRICDKTRPASVSSDTSKVINSRPSSTSSELWSSSSTLVSSRPESVNSDAIHSDSMSSQSSVVVGSASETRIHYASLDLAPGQDDDTSRNSTAVKNQVDGSVQTQEAPSIYAKIDFVVSEGLKQNNQSLPNNTRVNH